MRRWIAVLWHASFLVLAGVLYFFFVLPRWYELTNVWSFPLGTSMRIVCGALIGLAALPVVFTFLRTRKPEFGTPQLALSLRFWSIVLHVLAGVLIIGTAVSEIWLSLDSSGQYLFGIYGAAAAIALLGALCFYLAFVAELPPPPPKPLKPKGESKRRGRGKAAEDAADAETPEDTEATDDVDSGDADASAEEAEPAEVSETETAEPAETPEPETAEPATADADQDESDDEAGNAEASDDDESGSKLRNRRPGSKSTSGLFGRSRR
jgi:hypothetical protein